MTAPITIDDAIVEDLPSTFCDAVVACLLANTPLTALVSTKIYRHNPESIDTFVESKKIIVWPEPNLTNMNPQPGDYAHPTVTLVIMYIDDTKNAPLLTGEIGPSDVVSHCEMILERGTVDPDTGNEYETGKLVVPGVDPADPDVPDTSKWLNRKRPKFQKRSKRVIPQTNTTGWPVLVTYETTTSRETRNLK